jgi:hypothetical protein
LEKADILEMAVQHLQRLQQQQKQQQEQRLKQKWGSSETRATPALKQRERQHTEEWLEAYISTDTIQVKADFEHLEECSSLKQQRSSSAVSDTARIRQKQANETAATKGTRGDGPASTKFRAGFKECAREAGEILGRFDDVDPAVRERLSTHLALRLESLGNQNDVTSSCSDIQAADSTQNAAPLPSASPSVLIQTSTGFTLLPTKLPNGDLAFVIPAEVKKRVASRLGSECTRNYHANCGLECIEESKREQDGDVWRPW